MQSPPVRYYLGVPSARLPSPQVLAASHRFEVVRVDALAIPAQVVEVQRLIDRSDKKFVCVSMCIHVLNLATSRMEGVLTVPARLADGRSPFPTGTRRVDLRPEAQVLGVKTPLASQCSSLRGEVAYSLCRQDAMPSLDTDHTTGSQP